MKDVFPSMDNFETVNAFMQKRALLEYIMFKHIIQENYAPTIEEIANEASISVRDDDFTFLFQAVAQNRAIFIAHQDLYNNSMFPSTAHLNCRLSADFWIVNLMLKRADLGNIFSFEHLTPEQRSTIVGELNEKIIAMKKIIG